MALNLRSTRNRRTVGPPVDYAQTVCVVDDNARFQEMCRVLLEGAGHRHIPILDGDKTLEEARRVRPDVMMVDLRLGGRDGLQLIDELRADTATATIPILVCTASRDLLDQPLLDGRVCEVVEKPFEVDDLLSAIERCLARQPSRSS